MDKVNLPPGFRFNPTDEELLVHFLHPKASVLPCQYPTVIPDLDLCSYDPWELHGKALSGGKYWYFYTQRTQKRVTSNGHWKPTGSEECVESSTSSNNKQVGVKKQFVYYVGEAPLGIKTNWVMEELRLGNSVHNSGSSSRPSSKSRSHKKEQSKWVICKVYEGNCDDGNGDDGPQLSCMDELYLSLDDLDEISLPF